MGRILVIADEGVMRQLSDRFGAGGAVEVAGASSVRRALVQAAVERPGLIVCAERSLDASLPDLRNALQKLELADTHLLYVRQDTGEEADGDSPLADLTLCTEPELFETVASLLPSPCPQAPRPSVQLLASMDRLGFSEHSSGFANVLEVDDRGLVLEAPLLLEPGQRLALSFFLPGRENGSSHRVSLTGSVSGVVDEESLHYALTTEFMDPESRAALAAFLSDPNGGQSD